MAGLKDSQDFPDRPACDIVEHFKERASRPGAAPYQTQINQALRQAMERDLESFPGEDLVRDERFVATITERIKAKL